MSVLIDKVIFDALASHQSIVLPGVGSLEVRRRKAKKVSENQIIPPQNVVTFTTEEIPDTRTVAERLVALGDVPTERSGKTRYNSWLKEARSEKTISIKEVGEIKDEKFVIAGVLHNALNPDKEKIVTMEKEMKCKCGSAWRWVISIILLAILACCVFLCYEKGLFDGCCNNDKSAVESVEATPAAAVAGEQAVADKEAAEEPAGTTAPAPATEAPSATASEPAPAAPVYNVIAGTFSIESNADALVKKVKRDYPELNPIKMTQPSSGYTMVSIYQAPTMRDAFNTMNKYWDIDLYLWIYEK